MNDMVTGAVLQSAEVVSDESLIDVLIASVYPGAQRSSALLVINYCRAAGLDPLQKPVHIVPMKVKTGKKNGDGYDIYENRDVLMPGIGLYRITAHRTGRYAGMDEPVIGPMRKMGFQHVKREWVKVEGKDKKRPVDTVTEKAIDFPEWVSITVYSLVGGFRVAFTAKEYWLENYATANNESDAPNTMWAKRTIGQLCKCAEAQALRKAFPEVGSQPTFEELQGKAFDVELEQVEVETPAPPPAPRRKSEAATTGNVASQAAPAALADDTQQQDAAAAVGAALKPEQEAVLATVTPAATPAATPVAPPPAPAPAAAQQTQQASNDPPATPGEIANVKMRVTAGKADLPAILAKLGFALDPTTLAGMTKGQFKAIRGAL